MRILIALTYYRPYTSGLTIYVERLARAFASRGHSVTVLTSRYERRLRHDEQDDGIRIIRAPVIMRISKGVIMPNIYFLATKLALNHDVIHLHLPQFDAGGIALLGRLLHKPTVITYHCDLKLPPGILNRFINGMVYGLNHIAAAFSNSIVTYTKDYADNSAYLMRYLRKLDIISPPVELPEIRKEQVAVFGRYYNPQNRRPVIGMAARFAAEKGIEVLLDAMPCILNRYPQALVLYAGQYEDVLGEGPYFRRIAPLVSRYQAAGNWKFLGSLDSSHMAAFYGNLDVLVVPSLNATESFGLVQIEAMIKGVPVVASDLPGVRCPVGITGMGEICDVENPGSLAAKVLKILKQPEKYKGNPDEIACRFRPDIIAMAYEGLFERLLQGRD